MWLTARRRFVIIQAWVEAGAQINSLNAIVVSANTPPHGIVAQLAERCTCNAEVAGSVPVDSTVSALGCGWGNPARVLWSFASADIDCKWSCAPDAAWVAGSKPAQSRNNIAGWSSPVARESHKLEVVSSNLTPATHYLRFLSKLKHAMLDIILIAV